MRRFVVVYWSGSDWRWRTLTAEGRILKSSEEGYSDRDGALEAAYRENPHTPVEVDVLFSATAVNTSSAAGASRRGLATPAED
jgi:uncharacterized protein YegP (UPF0339 family)